MLIGRILVAIAGAIVMGSPFLPDGAAGSLRSWLLFAAGIYIAAGEVLVIYGDSSPTPIPP